MWTSPAGECRSPPEGGIDTHKVQWEIISSHAVTHFLSFVFQGVFLFFFSPSNEFFCAARRRRAGSDQPRVEPTGEVAAD